MTRFESELQATLAANARRRLHEDRVADQTRAELLRLVAQAIPVSIVAWAVWAGLTLGLAWLCGWLR